MMGEFVLYAYLCDDCTTILKCPCFVDKKCPGCGNELLSNLYLDLDNGGSK